MLKTNQSKIDFVKILDIRTKKFGHIWTVFFVDNNIPFVILPIFLHHAIMFDHIKNIDNYRNY